MHTGKQRGTALIITISLIFIMFGLTAVMMEEMRIRNIRTVVNIEDIMSFEAAEAGIDAALKDLLGGGLGNLGTGFTGDANGNGFVDANEVNKNGGWMGGVNTGNPANPKYAYDGLDTYQVSETVGGYTVSPNYALPRGSASATTQQGDDCGPIPDPQEFDFTTHGVRIGDSFFFTHAINWKTDGVDNNGDGKVDDELEKDWFTIYAVGATFSFTTLPEARYTTIQIVASRLPYGNPPTLDAALEFQLAPYSP